MNVVRVALGVALCTVLVACTAGEPPRVAPPSPGSSPETTGSPVLPIQPGDLAGGEATVEVSGTTEGSLSLQVEGPATYRPPDGDLLVRWRDAQGNILGIGGKLFTGSRETSATLSVTLALAEGRGVYFSKAGECTIVIERADAGAFEGTFTCRGLEGGPDRRIDARGAFSGRTG